MMLNQSTVIHVVLKGFGEEFRMECPNCNNPVHKHDPVTAVECLELTSLEIQALRHTQDKEISVTAQ